MTPYVLGFEAGWIGEDPGGPAAPWEPRGAVRGQAVSEGHLAAPRRWWRREREVRTRPEWAAGAEAAAGRGRRLVGPSGGTASGRRGMGQRVGATRPAGGGLRGHGWEPPCRCCWRRWQGPPGGEGTEGIGTPPGPAAGAVPGAGFGVGPSARPRGSPVQGGSLAWRLHCSPLTNSSPIPTAFLSIGTLATRLPPPRMPLGSTRLVWRRGEEGASHPGGPMSRGREGRRGQTSVDRASSFKPKRGLSSRLQSDLTP